MNRIVLFTILLLIGFSNCKPKESAAEQAEQQTTQEVEQEVEQEAQQKVEQQTTQRTKKTLPEDRADLSFLLEMNGKYPYESNLFETEPMKSRLTAIMLNGKYPVFLERMEVQTPIEVNGNEVFMQGFMKHSSGEEEAALFVDVSKNLVWVLTFENGKDLNIFKDDRDVRMSLRFARKIKELTL